MEIKQEKVSINNIIESPINANEMNEKTFNRLVANIRQDKELTSSVLLMEMNGSNKLMCISGHHRIRAARKAKIMKVPAIIIPEIEESKRVALQLSHNDINGENDSEILSQMIKMLNEEDIRMIDTDNIEIIEPENKIIDYEIKPYKYVNVCLMPESAEELTMLINDLSGNDDQLNYLTTKENYDILRKVLTRAFSNGFKTAGRAFRNMMDVYMEKTDGTN